MTPARKTERMVPLRDVREGRQFFERVEGRRARGEARNGRSDVTIRKLTTHRRL